MNPRVLKIALAASVALNLFAIAGGVAAWARLNAAQATVVEAQRPPRGGPIMAVLDQLDAPTQVRVRQALRQSALAARPDFEESRSTRREAIALAEGEVFDPAAVAALLTRSRDAESRGRARLESDAVAILQTLEPADRAALSPILQRQKKWRRDREPAASGGGRPSR